LLKIVNKPEFVSTSELTGSGRSELIPCKNCTGEYYLIFPEEGVIKVRTEHNWS
jgi:hypothetical protein